MSDWQPSDDDLTASLAIVQEYFRRIDPVVGLRLNSELSECFRVFWGIINDPQNTPLLIQWEKNSSKWKNIFINGVTINTKDSLKITAYHATRIENINSQIIESLKDFPLEKNKGIAGGDMTIINAEYQAFILSARRCLDQLSYAISGFFKNECSSFRDLGSFLHKQKKLSQYADPLLSIYNQHEKKFHGWLLSRENRQSIRDSLAHTKSISVGTLNVNCNGIFFVGMDAPLRDIEQENVAEVVLKLFNEVQSCVNELVIKMAENLNTFLLSMTEVTE